MAENVEPAGKRKRNATGCKVIFTVVEEVTIKKQIFVKITIL